MLGLNSANKSLNAYRLHEILAGQGQEMELSTIYRNLDSLSKAGLIHFIGQGHGYVACKADHDHLTVQHFVCDTCSKVEEIALTQDIGNTIRDGIATGGRAIRHISVEILGTCSSCSRT